MTDAPNKFAAPFREMADRIERNLPDEFAGAILIVPPSGQPIAVMMADPTKDLEAFWSMAQGKVSAATQEFAIQKAQQPGFHGRR